VRVTPIITAAAPPSGGEGRPFTRSQAAALVQGLKKAA